MRGSKKLLKEIELDGVYHVREDARTANIIDSTGCKDLRGKKVRVIEKDYDSYTIVCKLENPSNIIEKITSYNNFYRLSVTDLSISKSLL